MESKKILFGVLTVAAMALPSCSGSPTHTPSSEMHFYKADLNHDGIIAPFPYTDEKGETYTVEEENLTWQESYDVLLDEANSMAKLNEIADKMNIAKDEINRTSLARYEVLHEAEELLMQTESLIPIYNYADPYLLKPDIESKSLYSTALGYKFFDRLNDNKGTKKFSVCLGTKAESMDPGYNSDSSTANIMSNVMVGVNKWTYEDGKAVVKPSGGIATYKKQLVVESEEEAEQDPEELIWIGECEDLANLPGNEKEKYYGTARYTITIKDGTKWSDGTEVTAFDLTYAWDRAASNTYNGSVLGMWATMFDCIRGYGAWNAVGLQDTADTSKWSDLDKEAWDGLTDEQRKEWTYAFNKKTKYDIDGLTNCKTKGGLAGVMLESKNKFIVQLVNDCDYFDQLLAFPAFFPVPTHTIITEWGGIGEVEGCASKENSTWWTKIETYPTTGAFMFKEINNTEAGKIVITKNTNTRDEFLEGTTTEEITFALLDADSTMYDWYKSNTLQMIDSVSSGVIDQVKQTADWQVAEQMGLYYASFNVNDNTFDTSPTTDEATRQTYRRIMDLLINRYDITEHVVKSGAIPANGAVSTGINERCIPEWDEKADPTPESGETEKGAWVAKRVNQDDPESELVSADWHERNGDTYKYLSSENYDYKNHRLGYRNNNQQGYGFLPVAMKAEEEKEVQEKKIEEAISLAKSIGIEWEGDDIENGHFANFPKVSLITNSGTGHEQIFERMQAYYDLFNIDLSIETQEWNAFLAARRNGAFAFARNGWIADYSDPRTYLDINRSDDSNNDTQLGKESTHRSH